MSRRTEHPLTRLAAFLGVLCVVALTVLAVSPELHAALHAAAETGHADCPAHADQSPAGADEHACVVTLFAGGVVPLLVFCLLVLAGLRIRGLRLPTADEFAAAFPRYRLAPSHAPPAA